MSEAPAAPRGKVLIRPRGVAPAVAANAGGGTVGGALGDDDGAWAGAGGSGGGLGDDDDNGRGGVDDGDDDEDESAIASAVERVALAAGRFEVADDAEDGSGVGAAYLRAADSGRPREVVLAAGVAAAAPAAATAGDTAAAATGGAAVAAAPRPIGPASRAAPVCCIVIGMAGSGKTTLMQRLNAETHMAGQPAYIVNLDPAVTHLPYGPNIDVRDTVNYKEVMKQYGLGPNGAIVTALNLFATRFDQVLSLLEARTPTLK